LTDARLDSAMSDFIFSFSSSRLKGLCFFFPLFLSFFDFLVAEEEGGKNALDKLALWLLVFGDAGDSAGGGEGDLLLILVAAASSSSSSSKGSLSVSFRTFDFSCVTTCFLRGNSCGLLA
jgi:hypothetical protein